MICSTTHASGCILPNPVYTAHNPVAKTIPQPEPKTPQSSTDNSAAHRNHPDRQVWRGLGFILHLPFSRKYRCRLTAAAHPTVTPKHQIRCRAGCVAPVSGALPDSFAPDVKPRVLDIAYFRFQAGVAGLGEVYLDRHTRCCNFST